MRESSSCAGYRNFYGRMCGFLNVQGSPLARTDTLPLALSLFLQTENQQEGRSGNSDGHFSPRNYPQLCHESQVALLRAFSVRPTYLSWSVFFFPDSYSR